MTPEDPAYLRHILDAIISIEEFSEGISSAEDLRNHRLERYRIEAGDVKALIFSGRSAPVRRERCEGVTGLTIEGHAAVNPAGRAVVIRTRAGA